MPRYTQPRRTWQYSNEFKAKAVELSQLQDVQVQDVARTLGIHPFMLSRWRKEYREGKVVADKRMKFIGQTPYFLDDEDVKGHYYVISNFLHEHIFTILSSRTRC